MTGLTDQTGFTVNYSYDAVGRLTKLTDSSGNLIESYSYDPAGNITTDTNGNGTSTTYQYNALRKITQIDNLAPNGSSNSTLTYGYNIVGEITSMTTAGTTTTYGYDADGELTSASSPGETILYVYYPAGNRTSVTQNGVVTNVTSNSLNEYTQAGNTTYQPESRLDHVSACHDRVCELRRERAVRPHLVQHRG
jgi:YD repeat-containing protein